MNDLRAYTIQKMAEAAEDWSLDQDSAEVQEFGQSVAGAIADNPDSFLAWVQSITERNGRVES